MLAESKDSCRAVQGEQSLGRSKVMQVTWNDVLSVIQAAVSQRYTDAIRQDGIGVCPC